MEQPADLVVARADGQDEAWRRERPDIARRRGQITMSAAAGIGCPAANFAAELKDSMESFNPPSED